MLGTLHAVSQSLFGEYIATALLKDFDLAETTHCLTLTAELQPHLSTLLNMLKGNFPDEKPLLHMFSSFRSILLGITVSYTAASIIQDMDEFEKFVSFLVVLLSALGFSVGNLLDLVTGAKQMTFFLDSNQIEVLTRTLLPSLMDTLVTFGGGVKAWMQSYSTELLGELVPISTRIKRASDRALELSKEKADDYWALLGHYRRQRNVPTRHSPCLQHLILVVLALLLRIQVVLQLLAGVLGLQHPIPALQAPLVRTQGTLVILQKVLEVPLPTSLRPPPRNQK